jgi:DNA repair protein RadD
MKLRDYQADLKKKIQTSWDTHRNTLAVMATGGGKSVVIGSVVQDEPQHSVTIAHRQELVTQLSGHLARSGARHRVIAPKPVVRRCMEEHRRDHGRSFIDVSARAAVAGVDTLVSDKRVRELRPWLDQVRLWVIDEAAHVLAANKWGKAVSLFPNARGLGVTATPTRTDGSGLGAHASGVFHDMVIGPDTARLIREGHLTDYEILLPETDLDVTSVRTTATGDFSPTGLRSAVRESHLVGDVVATYLQYARGKRTVVFATDVETAEDMASRFRECGVPAEAVTGKTQDAERARRVQSFRDGALHVLVSVDIFDEGFDLPAIEVVQMARPTWSLSKYLQQIGRGLRTMPGKHKALVIDHVSNVRRHGLPDAPRVWTLSDRERRSRNVSVEDWVEPVKRCTACLKAYPATSKVCTHCGHEPVPVGGGRTVKEVDGDLTLLTGEALDALRRAATLEAPDDVGKRAAHVAGPAAGAGATARQRERIEAQNDLKEAVAVWAGHRRAEGRNDSEIHRLFYFRYGLTVLEALALKRADMLALIERIEGQ